MGRPDSVFDRSDDRSGTIVGVFLAACDDLGNMASAAKVDPKRLAEQVFRALTEIDCGQYDGLIQALRNRRVTPLVAGGRVRCGPRRRSR